MIVLHHQERRIVEARDGLRQRAEAPVFRLGRQRQADRPFGVGGIVEDHIVGGMLLVAAHLLLVFVYPCRHWLAGLACFSLLDLVIFLANLVMRDTDNPFYGIWNVSSKPFSDLLV
jgi:hypothetical protein